MLTSRRRKTIAMIAILVVWVAITLFDNGLGSFEPRQIISDSISDANQSTSGIEVYFMNPNLEGYRDGPDMGLIEAIESARAEVDVAAYDFNLWGMRDALLDAHQRGVSVRLVVEADQLDRPELKELVDAGIPIETDFPDGLMHNKFVIIDRYQVWTGSMNFTVNGAYRHDNNLISISSADVAAAYLAEYNEMFVEGLFGAYSPKGTGTSALVFKEKDQEVPVKIYFSPDDGVLEVIVSLLKNAQTSIQFLAFSFTSDEIAEVMLAQSRNGVIVQGVFDQSQVASNRGGEYQRLLDAGLDVRLDGSREKMHHKLIIIDENIVITGSYNFSNNAERRNDENLVVLEDAGIAQLFLQEWDRIYQLSE